MRLDFITKGNPNTRGKSKIYFCGHPADYDSVFKEITEDILEIPNCTIWYDTEPETTWNDEDLFSNLSEMQLFVIPVTRHFLYEESRAFSKELPFATKNHIPILPIMEDNSLEHIFEEKCGNLQSLKKCVKGPDTLPYKDRLTKYLNQVLIGSEWLQKIPQVFGAKIFLAYRKDDRKFAHRFMHAVHKDIRFRNIAIWYDEFLEIGNDYSQEINDAIKSSNIFAMVVTPNILADMGYNYVKEREYPFAVSLDKKIMPVEFKKTDHEKLKNVYKGIPNCISIDNTYDFYHALESELAGNKLIQYMDCPEHQFLLGLAYLGGISVEKNTEYAVQLITSAGESGLPQAIERLTTMYYYGEAVKQDLTAAIHWQKRLIQYYKKEYERTGGREYGIHIIFEQHKLYEYYIESHMELDARELSIYMKKFSSELRKKHPRDYSVIECLIISLSDGAGILYKQGDIKAAKKIQMVLRPLNKLLAYDVGLPDADEDLLLNYQHLGRINEEKNDFKSALKYYKKSLQISEKMKNNDGSDLLYQRWLNDLYRVGRCYLQLGLFEKSETYLKNCLKGYTSLQNTESDLWRIYYALSSVSCQKFELDKAMYYCNECIRLTEHKTSLQDKRYLADSYARKSDILKAEKHFEAARSCYLLTLDLMKQIYENTGEYEDAERLWRTYGMSGDCYFEVGHIKEAKRDYQKSLDGIILLNKQNTIQQNEPELAQGYQRMGMIAAHEGKTALAMEYFMNSLTLLKKTEKKHSDSRLLMMKKLLKEQIKTLQKNRGSNLSGYFLCKHLKKRA